MSLAAKLPYSHPYANGFGYGGTNVPTDTDGLDYLSRMATADGAGLETGVAGAIDRFIKACKTSDIWDSIRSSCILAGARSLNGALVPLREYGPELWDAPTPTITNAFGSNGTWDANTQTATSSTTTISNTFPRFKFPVGIVAGKDYRLTATLVVTDADALTYYRLGGDGVVAPPSAVNGVITIDETRTASTGAAVFELDFDSTIGPASVTIQSLSIREVIAAPTNVADGFVEGDYSRTAGLKGDGTSYIDSGRAGDDDPQDDNHNAVYISATPLPSNVHLGSGGASSGANTLGGYDSSGGYALRSRSSSFASQSLGAAVTNFAGSSRDASASFTSRVNGVSNSEAVASQTPSSDNTFVFARNNGSGTPQGLSQATLAFYSIGTSLGTDPAVGLADLDTAVTNLMADITFFFNTGLNPADYDTETVRYVNAGYAAGGTLE